MSDAVIYLRSWLPRQPADWGRSRDASSVAWEFLGDPSFWSVHFSLCGLLGSANEPVIQTAVTTALGFPYGPEAMLLIDALKLTCERGRNIKVGALVLGGLIALISLFG